MIKRVSDLKVPVKDFQIKTKTTPIDNIDPKLQTLMDQYQSRATKVIEAVIIKNEVEDEKQECERRKLLQEAESREFEEFVKSRNLPADVVQQIVQRKTKLEDSKSIDKPTYKKILNGSPLTREEALKIMSQKK